MKIQSLGVSQLDTVQRLIMLSPGYEDAGDAELASHLEQLQSTQPPRSTNAASLLLHRSFESTAPTAAALAVHIWIDQHHMLMPLLNQQGHPLTLQQLATMTVQSLMRAAVHRYAAASRLLPTAAAAADPSDATGASNSIQCRVPLQMACCVIDAQAQLAADAKQRQALEQDALSSTNDHQQQKRDNENDNDSSAAATPLQGVPVRADESLACLFIDRQQFKSNVGLRLHCRQWTEV